MVCDLHLAIYALNGSRLSETVRHTPCLVINIDLGFNDQREKSKSIVICCPCVQWAIVSLKILLVFFSLSHALSLFFLFGIIESK